MVLPNAEVTQVGTRIARGVTITTAVALDVELENVGTEVVRRPAVEENKTKAGERHTKRLIIRKQIPHSLTLLATFDISVTSMLPTTLPSLELAERSTQIKQFSLDGSNTSTC